MCLRNLPALADLLAADAMRDMTPDVASTMATKDAARVLRKVCVEVMKQYVVQAATVVGPGTRAAAGP